MYIDSKKLKKLPVETKSGHPLGRINNIEINIDNNSIEKYSVVRKRFFAKSPQLLISPVQIISINDDKIIVQDAVEGDQIEQLKTITKTEKQPLKVSGPAPIQAETQN